MKNLPDIPEEKEREIGEKLAAILMLKKSETHPDRFVMGNGHREKTALGVFRTVYGLIDSEIKELNISSAQEKP